MFKTLVNASIACALLISSVFPSVFAAPIPVETLFRHDQNRPMQLSPDGRFVAGLATVGGRINLVVVDLDNTKAFPVTGFKDMDVGRFAWVNDNRLVLTATDDRSGSSGYDQFFAGSGGIYAVDRDGSNWREVIPSPKKQVGDGAWHPTYGYLRRAMEDGSDDVIVQTAKYGTKALVLERVNTRNAKRQTLTYNMPGQVIDAVVDAKGVVRSVVTVNKSETRGTLWLRDSADAPWVKLEEFGMLEHDQVWPAAFDASGKELYVLSARGRDTTALFAYDIANRKLGEQLVAHPVADLADSGLIFARKSRELQGVTVFGDAEPETAWFDEAWATVQARVDATLKGRVNMVRGNASGRVLVYSYSDTAPGEYFLYDVKAGHIEPLLKTRPNLDGAEFSATRALRYPARDGLAIPAYLTLPKGKAPKRLPLVVLVHGGPWSRDRWGFNDEVQFLASRGYAVLQPQFRGSTGFGSRLYTAGFKQWGLKMQDDLNDGVSMLAKQGTIDPSRVCIMGASYGGFATMSALARDADKYRCGINMVGVTDPALFFSISWSDYADSAWIENDAKIMIGDPDADAEMFNRVSPLKNAKSIRAPVLMAYGAEDSRVPLPHGEKMRDALQANGTPVEWHVFAGEGHGFRIEENQFQLYHAIERFLAKYNPAD
ncbi:alpha/beta fold hydrolase [Niveibacterium sp.]|uniref:S9 family peptidase n=1 Tax=Niveibacterium sp. TaxID=2017444 RepID=UPI0035B2CCE6